MPNFKNVGLTGRLEAFQHYRKGGGALSFDEMLRIAEARYTERDLITINPDVEPFGINNSTTALMSGSKDSSITLGYGTGAREAATGLP